MSVPNWIPLPTPTGSTAADQCRSLGLVVGDVIRGREGVDETTLTLLWLGNEVAVWHVSRTLNSEAIPAHDERLVERESALWSLDGRQWDKLAKAERDASEQSPDTMLVVLEKIPVGSIREFALRHRLKIVVRERPFPIGDPSRFYAKFANCDTKGCGVLIGEFGNGSTPEEAVQAYANKISLKTLVHRGNTTDERLIPVWRLV